MTPEPTPTTGLRNDPPSRSGNQLPRGCLPGVAIVSIVILVLLGVLGVVVYLKPTNMMRFGLVTNIQTMENKLERERTLPPEQYQELKIYLKSLRLFIEKNEMDRANLKRLAPISKAFRAALQDGLVGRTELAAIRNAIWRSRIPLDVSGSRAPVSVEPVR